MNDYMSEHLDPDLDHAFRLLDVEMHDPHRLFGLVYPGEPKSKSRPRLARGGNVYTPSKPQQDALAQFLTYRFRGEKYTGNVAIAAVFYRPNFQRIDVDNMMKLVMDAATGVLWDDDDQVTFQVATAEYDPSNPRTIIATCSHTSTLTRGADALERRCARCGSPFSVEYRSQTIRYCSTGCRGKSIKQQKNHPGQGVGPKGQPPGSCVDCSAELAKRSFIRCRPCWKIARSKGIS